MLMYKVFIVDDEVVVREGIRNNVNWDITNFSLAGEAPDGEMALPLIQEIKPDILITDIKMPFMNGLELSRIIKKNMPWVKIIILSGHDEFNFAKEAISIGVTEYLLKPISSSDLIKSLNKIVNQIEAEKKERENIESIKHQLKNNSGLLKDQFLNELSLGIIQPIDAIEKCSIYNISLIAKYYLIAIIESEIKENSNSGKQSSSYLKIESAISGIVEGNTDIIRFKRNMEETVLIFKGDSPADLEESAYRISQSIKYEVGRSTGHSLTIGIGSTRERIQGITESFNDAETAKNYKYVFGKNKIIGIKDVKTDVLSRNELLKLDKVSIIEYLKCGVKSNIQDYLSGYIQCLSEPNLKSLIFTYYAFMDIVLTSARFVKELGGDFEALIPEVAHIESIVENMDSINKFMEYAEKIFTKVFDFRDSKTENRYGNIIYKARDYINSNYFDPELSLNSLASFVNISPSHFSTIFSQETGDTFIEYLTMTRMKKAMELLKTTNQKSSEIAYNVGYNDPHYFSYLFKKFAGLTPKEYRCEGQKE